MFLVLSRALAAPVRARGVHGKRIWRAMAVCYSGDLFRANRNIPPLVAFS